MGDAASTRRNNMSSRPVIAVVDDDLSIRESLADLLGELGYATRSFASATDFLASALADPPACLILDVAMPGMTGPELQLELTRRRANIPIVFVTAHRDEALRARLIAQGAVECLFKPFSDNALMIALREALKPA